MFTQLERTELVVDASVFRRAADQLDIADRFAGIFRFEPQFRAPAAVLAELRRRCPDLLG